MTIKPLVNCTYCEKTLSVSQINRIIKAVNERKTLQTSAKKAKQIGDMASVVAVVQKDWG
jgi:hypothetical protein